MRGGERSAVRWRRDGFASPHASVSRPELLSSLSRTGGPELGAVAEISLLAALGCGELRSVTLAVAEKLVNEQCDWGAGLRAILNARVFEKIPQIVCSVAFDGVLDKLV